jgi:hypothetical protein
MAWLFGQPCGWPHRFAVFPPHLITPPGLNLPAASCHPKRENKKMKTEQSQAASHINNIIETDMADIACQLDWLKSNPKITEDAALSGLVSAIKSAYIDIWNRLDDASDALPEATT